MNRPGLGRRPIGRNAKRRPSSIERNRVHFVPVPAMVTRSSRCSPGKHGIVRVGERDIDIGKGHELETTFWQVSSKVIVPPVNPPPFIRKPSTTLSH